MKRVRLRVGDIIEIPLSNGRRAYAQYVFLDLKWGLLLQVFDLITDGEIPLEQLKNARALFPPVLTGLRAAIRVGFWKIVGHMPVAGFSYPKFISTFFDDKTGKAGKWFLWDGEKSIPLGAELSPEYKKLEFLVIWDPHDVAYRIETGEYPFPYGDLIDHNSFTPRRPGPAAA